MISNFCLYTDLDTIKTEQEFFSQKLLINTNFSKDYDISTLFKSCYNEVLPYLSVFIRFYYLDPIYLYQTEVYNYFHNEQAIKLLEKNCIMTSLQTLTYLQTKNNTTSFQSCLKELMCGESCTSDDNVKLKRIFSEILANSYFDEFITLQGISSSKTISCFCPKLDLKLILNHQKEGTNTLGTISPAQITPLLSDIRQIIDNPIQIFDNKTPRSVKYKATEKLRKKCQKLLEKVATLNPDDKLLFKHSWDNETAIEWLIYQHNIELIFHSKAIQDFLLGRVPYDYMDEDNGPSSWLCNHQSYILLPLTYDRATLVSLMPTLMENSFNDVLFALAILFKSFFIALLNQSDFDIHKCREKLLSFILLDIKQYEENYFANNQSPQDRRELFTATYDMVAMDPFYLVKLGELLCNIYKHTNFFAIDIQYEHSKFINIHQLSPINRIKESIAYDIQRYFLDKDHKASIQLAEKMLINQMNSLDTDPEIVNDLFGNIFKQDFK